MVNFTSITSGYNYFWGNKKLDGLAGLEGKNCEEKHYTFIRAIQSVCILRIQPQEASENIVNTVLDPNRMGMISEGAPQTFASKIRKFVEDINIFMLSPEAHGLPTLTHFEDDHLIRNLVQIILNKGHSEDIKQRARFALLMLEKVDAGLSTWNYQISQLMDSKDEKARTNARRHLSKWIKTPLQSLQLSFPMKPHSISRKSPDYSSLISPEKIEEGNSLNSCWEFKKIIIGNKDEVAQCCFDNIKEIAQRENIPQPHQCCLEWLRDLLIILENGNYLIPALMNVGLDCLPKLADTGPPFMFLMNQLLDYPESLLGATSFEVDQIRGLSSAHEAPIYFEGGNLMPAIKKTGEKVFLCGASNFFISILNSDYLFSSKEKKKALLREMQALEDSHSYPAEQLSLIQNRLERGKLLANLNDNEKTKIAKLTIASARLFKKDISSILDCNTIVLGNIF